MILTDEFLSDHTPSLGESLRLDCPSCKRSGTFTITNAEGHLLWNCYSASCSTSGGKLTKVTTADITRMRAQPAKPKPFVLPDHVVWARPGLVAWANSNGISTTRVDIRSDVVECRAVFLIKDVVGNVVDATGRSMINSKPKWKRYGDSPVPYTHGSGPTTVVVEDAISAAVVGEYIDGATGVALLGTSLTPYIKEYLKQRSNVIIALDPDARKKALKMKRELSGYTNVHVVSLLDDIKYRRANDMFVISKLCNPN